MANQLKENEDQGLLEQKLSSALVIKKQVGNILDDSSHGEVYREKVMGAVDDTLHHMINTVDQETYSLYAKRLEKMILQVSQHEIPKEIDDKYRLVRNIHRAIEETSYNNKSQIENKIPEWCKAHPDYELWKEKIVGLTAQSSEENFNSLKSRSILSLVEGEQKHAKPHAISSIEQNISKMGATRQSSLKKLKNQSGKLKSLAWIGFGSLLVTAAAVLSLAFPPLIIPGLAVAGAFVVYGVTDLAKKGRALKKQQIADQLVDRGVSEKTTESTSDLAKKLGENPNSLEKKEANMKEGQAKENKKIRQLAFGLSSASLMVGIAAVAVALPMVAAPVGALIALVALSSALVVFTGGLFGYKRYKDQKYSKAVQSEVAGKNVNDDKIFSDLELKSENKLDSTAMMMRKEAGPANNTKEAVDALTTESASVFEQTPDIKKPPEPLTTLDDSVFEQGLRNEVLKTFCIKPSDKERIVSPEEDEGGGEGKEDEEQSEPEP